MNHNITIIALTIFNMLLCTFAIGQKIGVATYCVVGSNAENSALHPTLNEYLKGSMGEFKYIDSVFNESALQEYILNGDVPGKNTDVIYNIGINLIVWFSISSSNIAGKDLYKLTFTKINPKNSVRKFEHRQSFTKLLPDKFQLPPDSILNEFRDSIELFFDCNDPRIVNCLKSGQKWTGDTTFLSKIAKKCSIANELLILTRKSKILEKGNDLLAKGDTSNALEFFIDVDTDSIAIIQINTFLNAKYILNNTKLLEWWWKNLDPFWIKVFEEDIFKGTRNPPLSTIRDSLFSEARVDGFVLKLRGIRTYKNINGLRFLTNITQVRFGTGKDNEKIIIDENIDFDILNSPFRKKIIFRLPKIPDLKNLKNTPPEIVKWKTFKEY